EWNTMRFVSAAALAAAVTAFALPASAQDWGWAKTAGTILAGTPPAVAKQVVARKLNRPLKDREAFIAYMQKGRGDDREMLLHRWNRMQGYVRIGNLRNERDIRAFLLTAREEFSRTRDSERSYAPSFLDIGCGVTISGPGIVTRMTAELDVKPGEKVLEIGTGSGYQSAVLANLTDNVYTIEIIPPLARFTDKLQTEL